jgi:hypothetical protein
MAANMALMGASTVCSSDEDDVVVLEFAALELAAPEVCELARAAEVALGFVVPEVVACSDRLKARSARPARTEAV